MSLWPSLDFVLVVELKVEIDCAIMSSNISGGMSYSDPRTTMAYTAGIAFSTCPWVPGDRENATVLNLFQRLWSYSLFLGQLPHVRSKAFEIYLSTITPLHTIVKLTDLPALHCRTNAHTSLALTRPPFWAIPDIANRMSSPVTSDKPSK